MPKTKRNGEGRSVPQWGGEENEDEDEKKGREDPNGGTVTHNGVNQQPAIAGRGREEKRERGEGKREEERGRRKKEKEGEDGRRGRRGIGQEKK